MRKLDPQLEFLAEGGAAELDLLQNEAVMARFGMDSVATEREPRRSAKSRAAKSEATVLVQTSGDTSALEAAGLTVRGVAGDVVTGTVALGDLEKLAKVAEVQRIEAARALHAELDLSVSECRANLVHVGPPGRRGAGVIVGIVDSGCDYTHPSFRRPDGTSRILFIWDQGMAPAAGEASPAGFGYGVEYDNARINAALLLADPFSSVRHRDNPQAGFHGTHVAGIAAGDGSEPGQGLPGSTFIGVAPEADLIVVANASNGTEGLGTSASTLDAVNYIFQRAQTRGQPCAVNMSLGDNLGPHDGTSLLERGLDNLLGGPGRAFVKSAGNAGADRIHAEGNVASGATVDLRFNQPGGDATPNQIDLWYEGADAFRVTVINPAGNSAGPVNVGAASTVTLPGGNTVRIDHRNNDAFNGDKRVFMTFAPGAAGQMLAGAWTIRLTGVSSPSGGRFDAWIQRGAVTPTFLAPHESPARTISTPGTALEVITAAAYVTRGAGVGSLASFSSRGPTRDNRAAPTLAAPGSGVFSARGHFGTPNPPLDPYVGMSGTSMAAPHITGTIALMFQKNPGRTQAEIKACLESSARGDAFTGPTPNTAWGAGKLDAHAAVDCVPGLRPIQSVITICPSIALTAACRSVATPCISVPIANCPSVIQVSCQSVTITACGGPSVPRLSCPSVLQVNCPTATFPICGGQSVPVTTCPVASVAAPCVTVARCPSVVDGCPSTPGGCGFTVVVNPDPLVNPGVAVNPGVTFDPGVAVNPGFALNPAVAANLAAMLGGMGPGGFAQAREGGQPSTPETPPAGYFDYDDSWFD
jgi:subtilisin family serine protease